MLEMTSFTLIDLIQDSLSDTENNSFWPMVHTQMIAYWKWITNIHSTSTYFSIVYWWIINYTSNRIFK